MRLHYLPLIVAAALATSVAAEDFQWDGQLAAGKTLEIKGVNGNIEARASSDGRVRVEATKKARRSDPDSVKIEVVEHGVGVTICAVYPGRGNECAPGKRGRMNVKNNDVNVRFDVAVPDGVRFVARTVNGEVEATGLGAEVEAVTVNGSIHVTTSGSVRGETVNGSIRASLGTTTWKGPLDFETVNGGITVDLPAGVGARVSAKTVNGSIETDFPLTVKGKFGKRSINGTIGGGGGELNLETVNGGIRLRESS
jgi:hypothetical protein